MNEEKGREMTQEERAQALAHRIADHLMAEGFRDEQLYPRTSITHDHQVMVGLYSPRFNCAACSQKGLLVKFADLVKGVLGAQWCSGCRSDWQRHQSRSREVAPRLKVVLERAFTVREIGPEHPGSIFVIAP